MEPRLRALIRACPYLLVGGATGLTLLVALALIPFAHPMGDDFCNAANVADHGVLGTVQLDYVAWGGRWSGHFLLSLFPALFDITSSYPIGLAIVFASSLLAIWLLLTTALPLKGQPATAWGLSTCFVALHWAGMPHPGQTVYWLEGAVIYSFNVSLGMIVIAGLLRLPRAPSMSRSLSALGLAMGAFLIAAFHELFGLVLGGLLVVGWGVARYLRDDRSRAWALAAAGVALSIASVAFAPGRDVRQGYVSPGGQSLASALGASFFMWVRLIDVPGIRGGAVGRYSALGWLLDPRLLGATLLVIGSGSLRVLRPGWLGPHQSLWRLVLPLTTAAVLAGSFLVGGWALQRTLPLRAFNGLYVVFLLGWFFSVFVLSHTDGKEAPETSSPWLRAAGALLLTLGLLTSTNLKLALRDLARGTAPTFHREMQARYTEARRLSEGNGRELHVTAPIQPWPDSYFENDLDVLTPPLRECVARFFDVDSLNVGVRPAPRAGSLEPAGGVD